MLMPTTEDGKKDFFKRYERKPDLGLWSRIQKNAKGNETQKCEAVKEVLTNYYKTPNEADGLVRQLAMESPEVRMEIAKLLEKGEKNFSFGLYSELNTILGKDDNAFVKKVLKEEQEKQFALVKPFMTNIMYLSNRISEIGDQLAKRTASINIAISKATEGIHSFERSIPLEAMPRAGWQEEREKLLNYITVLEKALESLTKEKEHLLKMLKESKNGLKKKTDYIS